MKELMPLLQKRSQGREKLAQGREISGLGAYEQ
jgi:hypothetical protein